MSEQLRSTYILAAHMAATEAWQYLMDVVVKLNAPELDRASMALGATLKAELRALLEFLISDQTVIGAEDRNLFSRLLLDMKALTVAPPS